MTTVYYSTHLYNNDYCTLQFNGHYCNDDTLPMRCVHTGQLPRCVGYGIVRAVDVCRRVLYVCTPVLEQSILSSVNVLAKGNIDLPTQFLSAQVCLFWFIYMIIFFGCFNSART